MLTQTIDEACSKPNGSAYLFVHICISVGKLVNSQWKLYWAYLLPHSDHLYTIKWLSEHKVLIIV